MGWMLGQGSAPSGIPGAAGGMQRDGAALDAAVQGTRRGTGQCHRTERDDPELGEGCLRWDPFAGTGLTPPLSA